MKPENMKKAYEWVLVPQRGDDIILTERQYQLYKDQVKEGDTSPIFFDEVEVKPPYIVMSFRRDASVTKEKYPCLKCDTNGFLNEKDADGVFLLCPTCEGSGIDTN